MSIIGRVCVGLLLIVCAVSAASAQGGRRPTTLGGSPVESAKFYACALAKIKTSQPPRTAYGRPDSTGFCSRIVTTEDLHGRPEVGGQSAQWSLSVDPPDGKIPYQPWAAAQKATNLKQYIPPTAFRDVPGVPRSNFQFAKW